MTKLKLHLDADTSIKALVEALTTRGFDVTRTPSGWIKSDDDDEVQLLGATAQGRCIFTFNIRDFQALAQKYPQHEGIILAAQRSWALTELIRALSTVLSETQAEAWRGQVRWLNDWRR